MKAITLLCIAFCSVLGYGQDTGQEKRLTIASEWLYRLCVVPSGDFRVLSPAGLRDAFDTWIKMSGKSGSCDPTTFGKSKEDPLAIRVDVSSIRLNLWERLARVPQFRTQIQQTPDYVYGILQGSPPNTPSQFFANPDHSLFSYGGPVHLDEFYVGADTRVAICSVLDDVSSAEVPKHKSTDRLCQNSGYLLANRKVDNLTRIGAAIALDINFSQVPRYQAPIIIASLAGINYPTWSKTITGSFDASKLFRSAAELKGVAGYVNKLDPKDKVMGRDEVLKDFCSHKVGDLADAKNTTDCIQAITIGALAKRLAISFLPRLDVKALSPFDLSKYGSSFVAPPNRAGRSLYTVTLNWDLRSLIPATKDRLDAFNAVKALHDLPTKPLDENQLKEELWRRQVSSLYVELSEMPERSLDSSWWAAFENTVLKIN